MTKVLRQLAIKYEVPGASTRWAAVVHKDTSYVLTPFLIRHDCTIIRIICIVYITPRIVCYTACQPNLCAT